MELQKKDKIQICITGVLIVVLAVVLAGTFGGKKRGRPSKKKGSTVSVRPSAPVSAPAVPVKISLEQLKEEARSLRLRRDPFSRQPVSSTVSRGGPHLKGIVWDPKEPTAIINEGIVHVGDEMDGYRVLDIKKDAVTLHDGVQEIELKLEMEE